MAILTGDDVRHLSNWYRDELTFLGWIGKAVTKGDINKAMALINQRRDMVGVQINKLADAVGVERP